jgi:hypothetical protein
MCRSDECSPQKFGDGRASYLGELLAGSSTWPLKGSNTWPLKEDDEEDDDDGIIFMKR